MLKEEKPLKGMHFCFLLTSVGAPFALFILCFLPPILLASCWFLTPFSPDGPRSPHAVILIPSPGGRGGVSGTCSVIRLWAFSPHEVASVLPRALSAAARRLIPRDSLFLALWRLGGLGFMDTRGVQWAAFCCRDGRKPGDVTLLDFDESRIFRYSL